MGTLSKALCLLLLCFALSASECSLTYKNPKKPLSARIKDLMNRMTLQEKIGQMVQIDLKVATPEVMKKYIIGSVLSGGGSVPAPKATPETWVNMVNEIQKASLSTRLGIPMIYGIDAIHGHNNVDPKLLKRIGEAAALEVRATGIQHAFAPGLSVCRDPRWGSCYESYSEDYRIVKQMTEIIPGLQGDIPTK